MGDLMSRTLAPRTPVAARRSRYTRRSTRREGAEGVAVTLLKRA